MRVFLIYFSLHFTLVAFSFQQKSLILDNLPPRGPNTEASAGNCDIGPFGGVGDAGPYKNYCKKLSNNEKCFAFLRQHITEDGQIDRSQDQAKAVFCLNSVLGRIVD